MNETYPNISESGVRLSSVISPTRGSDHERRPVARGSPGERAEHVRARERKPAEGRRAGLPLFEQGHWNMPVYTNCLQLSFTSRRARARHVCEIFLAARAVLSPRGAEKHARPRGEGGGDFRAEMSISDLPHMPDYCSSSPPSPLLEVTWSLFSDRSANRPTRVPTRFTLRRTADAA